jgi:predicted MFS family arabinose efflux permease
MSDTTLAAAEPANKPIKLVPALTSFVVLRFAMDAAYRAPLPFVIFIAAAFSADAASAGWLAVALNVAGLTAPFIGVAEGKLGRRAVVIGSVALFVAACMLMPFSPTFGVALGLCFLLGLSRSLFTPQVQAFVGDVVPYEKLGTAIGIIELSWALSFIIGAPLFGFLIERAAWWLPFVMMGIIAVIGLAMSLRLALRKDSNALRKGAGKFDWGSLGIVLRSKPAVLVLIFGGLISFAHQLLILTYAPYMSQRFGLSIEQVGIASIVLGVADVIAEVLIILLVDRIGKRKAVLVSTALYVLAFGLAILWAGALVPLLAALFLVSLTFEFALVASLPVASEVVPPARTTMMGFVVFSHALSRIVGSAVALPLFAGGSIELVLLIALISVAVSFVSFWPVRVNSRRDDLTT